MPRPLIQTECSECHKPIARHQNKDNNYFCSRACQDVCNARRKPKFTRPCDTCGKPVHRRGAEKLAKYVFCNHQCYAAWKKQTRVGKDAPQWRGQEVVCTTCGKRFLLPQSRIKRAKHYFCSLECHAPYLRGEQSARWKGGVNHYGPSWKKQRAAAMRRDKARCQHCGKKHIFMLRVLDVHHIQPFRTFNGNYLKANQLENLITLCKKCHGMAERGVIAIQPKLL